MKKIIEKLQSAFRRLRQPRFRYGAASTLMVWLVIGVLVILNLLVGDAEKRHGWQADLSFNAMTTQSATTRAVVEALPYPVHIYALFSRGQEDVPLMALLDRYAASSPNITWSQADVALQPWLIQRFSTQAEGMQVQNDSLIVSCETTGRWRILSPTDFVHLGLNLQTGAYEPDGLTYEHEITAALVHVTRDTIPKVYLLQGQGELDESLVQPLTDFLTSNHYEVAPLHTLVNAQLTKNDLLMVLSPTRDFLPDEIKVISDFTAGGGSLFITTDYTDPLDAMPNWTAFLRRYGIIPLDGIVVSAADEPHTYAQGSQINLLPILHETEATVELVRSNQNTLLFTGSRAFETPKIADQSLEVDVLVSSDHPAYLRDFSDGNTSLAQQPEDQPGPFALGLLARRLTEGGELSRVAVLGSSPPLTSTLVQSMTDTQVFLLRLMEYLLNTPPIQLDILAKPAIRPRLTAGSTAWGLVLTIAVPLAVTAAGAWVLIRRKRKAG